MQRGKSDHAENQEGTTIYQNLTVFHNLVLSTVLRKQESYSICLLALKHYVKFWKLHQRKEHVRTSIINHQIGRCQATGKTFPTIVSAYLDYGPALLAGPLWNFRKNSRSSLPLSATRRRTRRVEHPALPSTSKKRILLLKAVIRSKFLLSSCHTFPTKPENIEVKWVNQYLLHTLVLITPGWTA